MTSDLRESSGLLRGLEQREGDKRKRNVLQEEAVCSGLGGSQFMMGRDLHGLKLNQVLRPGPCGGDDGPQRQRLV